MVKKQDGSWKPCGDFGRLDLVTGPDVLDFAAKAAGCRVFLKGDLRKARHQILVNLTDIWKTAKTTFFSAALSTSSCLLIYVTPPTYTSRTETELSKEYKLPLTLPTISQGPVWTMRPTVSSTLRSVFGEWSPYTFRATG